MKLLFVCGALLISFAVANAQDWAKERLNASPRHTEWVDVKYGNRTVKTFVVYPERKDKAPVVLLIHEIFGASDWAMNLADEIAAAGYIAVEPDLLSGMAPNGGRTSDFGGDNSKITEAVSNLPQEQVTADLNAVADYALKIPSASGKISVAGFCWGGTQTFRFATARPDLSAAFVFYGIGPQEPAEIAKIKAPVYGFYGGIDNRVTTTVDDQKKLMADGGKHYEANIYEGAGHGFMRAGEQPDPKPDNRKARELAWTRWMDILSKQ